ncbi:MAG: SDR family NAD(P)-dependent oxidoreductase [Rheinheimera sp.]|nr:MAG: SDR family NAD(P)-dependent oxidoreductase [Rheinheimera sp.]
MKSPLLFSQPHETPPIAITWLQGKPIEAAGGHLFTKESRVSTETRTNEIAIIGMGCRFPGGADDPAAFWQMLTQGVDGIVDVPPERWDIRKYYDADPHKAGKTYARQGGFIRQRLDHFDPQPFSMSPKEAEVIDLMQRLLLEVAWETLEDAGMPQQLAKQKTTGVFIGAFAIDNKAIQLDGDNLYETDSHTAFGVTMALLSNRISYAFDLTGPSFTVDTACSASMTALHLAVQSLRNGDCEMALVGGANAMMTPHYPVVMSKGQFLSAHSRCKAFDADAGGYVRAEGAGMVLLKPLTDAVRDGDHIHAVIVETGINQDGQTKGISLPNPDAQFRLLEQVYQRAGVAAEQLSYIEAHGTGTRVGDPLEIAALGRALAGRSLQQPCLIGSVKTNIGHTEAASAMAGLIKATLIAREKQVPANLHFHTPNPEIPFAELPLKVVTALTPLDADKTHFIGVNSFGYGGSNGHVIVRSTQQHEFPTSAPAVQHEARQMLVPFSARSERALQEVLQRFRDQLKQQPDIALADWVYSLSRRRTALTHRLCLLADSPATLLQQLQQQLSQPLQVRQCHQNLQRLAMVCTGMGPQWWGMGQELYRTEPVFRAALEQVDQVFHAVAGWSVLSEMLRDEASSRMHETQVAQPANFALQVALFELWAHFGVKPAVLIGHSVGEVASAYLSGALSLQDACKVSYHRSRLQQQCANLDGGMLAVGLTEGVCQTWLQQFPAIEIAALNGPEALTLAGPRPALQALAQQLEEQQIFCRLLQVEIAYHSSQMQQIESELLEVLSDLQPRACRIPLVSTVTGLEICGETLDAGYWWRNVRQTVLFAAGFQSVLALTPDAVLELGPHPVLKQNIRELLSQQGLDLPQLASLQRKAPEQSFFLGELARWFNQGGALHWQAFYGASPRYVPLPLYPWQREHLWRESGRSVERRIGRSGAVYLNEQLPGAGTAWGGEINRHFMPYLSDHQVNASVVFPGAAIIDALFCAAAELSGAASLPLEQLQIEKMLQVPAHAVMKTEIRYNAAQRLLELSSRDQADKLSQWQRNASARLCQYPVPVPALDGQHLLDLAADPAQIRHFYQTASSIGLQYGPAFQTLTALRIQPDSVSARLLLGDAAAQEAGQYLLHPTLLDGAFQSLLALVGDGPAYVPQRCGRLTLLQLPGDICFSHCRLLEKTTSSLRCELALYNDAGVLCLLLEDLECRAIELAAEQQQVQNPVNYQLQWLPQAELPALQALPRRVLIIDDGSELAFATNAELQQRGVLVRSYRVGSLPPQGLEQPDVLLDFSACLWPEMLLQQPELLLSRLTDAIQSSRALLQRLDDGKQPWRYLRLTIAACQVLPDDSAPNWSAAALTGLSAAIINEYPVVFCQNLDLSSDGRAALQQLLQELQIADQTSDVAWRDNNRYRRELCAEPAQSSAWQQIAADTNSPVELRQFAMTTVQSNTDNDSFTGCCASPAVDSTTSDTTAGTYQLTLHSAALSAALRQGLPADLLAVAQVRQTPPVATYQHGDLVLLSQRQQRLQSQRTASAAELLPLPDGFLPAQIALVEPYTQALYCLTGLSAPTAGQRLLLTDLPAALEQALRHVAATMHLQVTVLQDHTGTDDEPSAARLPAQQHFGCYDLSFFRPLLQQAPFDLMISAASSEIRDKLLSLPGRQRQLIDLSQQPLDSTRLSQDDLLCQPDLAELLHNPGHRRFVSAALQFIVQHSAELSATQSCPAALLAQTDQLSDNFDSVLLHQQPLLLLAPFATPWLPPQSSVLITGGAAGFGLTMARQLADWGAARLVLASRSGQLEAKALQQLQQRGVQVETVALDVTDAGAVRDAVALANHPAMPLRIVVHCAGVLADGYLRDLSADTCRSVLAPKILGALHLHQALAALPPQQLQRFICCSSVSALVGNPGQANYVVANNWLDEFCHWRCRQGLPALSVNWGALAGAGMVARDAQVRTILAGQGVHAISDHYAFDQLRYALSSDTTQVGIMDIEWPLWFNANQAARRSGRFRQIVQQFGQQHSAGRQFRQQLQTLPAAERKNALLQALQKQVANLLRYQPEQVDVRISLTQLGVDSLTTNQLSKQLLTQLGLAISSMSLLAGPSLEQLAQQQLALLNEDAALV